MVAERDPNPCITSRGKRCAVARVPNESSEPVDVRVDEDVREKSKCSSRTLTRTKGIDGDMEMDVCFDFLGIRPPPSLVSALN